MRHPRFGLAVALGVFLLIPAGRAHAQLAGGLGNDPFSLYYGFYLPHQAAIAAQPTPLDTINAVTAARQFTAVTDRAALYDPISPYSDEELDPLAPFSARRGRGRTATIPNFANNARGTGPALYYNRLARYYPNLRSTGRGPNRNLAHVRSGRFGGGGGGISGGFSGGMPMPSSSSFPGGPG